MVVESGYEIYFKLGRSTTGVDFFFDPVGLGFPVAWLLMGELKSLLSSLVPFFPS
jgi:hypothetical protein